MQERMRTQTPTPTRVQEDVVSGVAVWVKRAISILDELRRSEAQSQLFFGGLEKRIGP